MKDKIGTDNKVFEIVLNKEQQSDYIISYDPYDENSTSFSIGVISKTKKVFEIRKIKGFKRIIDVGWQYIVEKIIK